MRADDTDLNIIRLLARDSRTHYKDIASAVGITPNAAKSRIDKMISNDIIQKFIVLVNPVIFGYDKECILIVKNIDKTIKEQDIFKKVSLLGDVFTSTEHLGGIVIFALYVMDITEDKIRMLTDLIKPATLEILFAAFRPPTMTINISDLEIMKCLLSNPRMLVDDIAKETSYSRRTVARRLEKMRENHVLQLFTIMPNLSSLRLTGYMEFIVIIHIRISSRQSILERIHRELDEYLFLTADWIHKEVIVAVFFAANISTVNLILKRLESYDEVNKVESFITTSLRFYQDWLKSKIDKRIITQKHSSLSSTIDTAAINDR